VNFVVRISLDNAAEIGDHSTAGKHHLFHLIAGNPATGETYIKAR
jgi:ABC-type thiamine transport system ATPase subunit